MKRTSTVSSKGQITIPAWARRALDLEPGAQVHLRLEGDHLILEPVQRALEALEGSLPGLYGDPDEAVDALREDRLP